MTYEVTISMLEIYNENINDLLTNPPTCNLKIREFPKIGMKVIGLEERPCTSPELVFKAIAAGTANKHTGSHAMNTRSSRSHTVFQLGVVAKSITGSICSSKINMIDLAGSERIKKTLATGKSLEEAKKINLSLSNLGNCINAIVEHHSSIPFRESKLTLILKDSLGGNSLTSLCVMTSKRLVHGDETYSTLMFGDRAKQIKCKVRKNEVKSTEELLKIIEQLKAEIERLKKGLPASEMSDSIIPIDFTMDPGDIIHEDLSGIGILELQAKYGMLEESS